MLSLYADFGLGKLSKDCCFLFMQRSAVVMGTPLPVSGCPNLNQITVIGFNIKLRLSCTIGAIYCSIRVFNGRYFCNVLTNINEKDL